MRISCGCKLEQGGRTRRVMGRQPPPNRRPTPTHLRSQAAAWNSVRQRATVGLLHQRRHAAAQAQGAQGARRLPCVPAVQPRVDAGEGLLRDAARGPREAARQRCRLRRSVQLLLLLLLLLLQVLLLLEGGGGEAGGARRRRSRACGRGGGGRGSGPSRRRPRAQLAGWVPPEQARQRRGAGLQVAGRDKAGGRAEKPAINAGRPRPGPGAGPQLELRQVPTGGSPRSPGPGCARLPSRCGGAVWGGGASVSRAMKPPSPSPPPCSLS